MAKSSGKSLSWNIAIFASGNGSNARALMQAFQGHQNIRIRLVISNKPDAGVLIAARDFAIPSAVITGAEMRNEATVISLLKEYEVHCIVLAGYLLKIPDYLISAYPDLIVNIHPSLLPAYGGKGMYGHHVHEAVHRNKETVSGLTIHLVNQQYDEGRILFQKSVPLSAHMQPADIAAAILKEEHRYYASVVEDYLASRGSQTV